MKNMITKFLDRLRIIWIIASKDLREAVKNKNTLTVIGAALFIVVVYRLMPGLTSNLHPPELIVYDSGQSQIIAQVEAGSTYQLFKYPTLARMEERVAASEAPYLGLAIPADFDQKAAAGVVQELQGYIIYWASSEKANAIRLAVEAELTRLAGAPVHIKAGLNPVYPESTQNQPGNWAALTLVFALMTISIQLIPNLMLEEKNTHTLDALLVSPASSWELAGGKALAGLFYALLASAVIVIVFLTQIIHFLPILLAVVAGALFMVLVGLWTGLKVENRGQLGIFVLVLVMLLFIPVVVYQLSDLFEGNLGHLLRWLPTNAMFRLVQAAFGESLEPANIAIDTSVLLAWGLLVGVGLVWQVQSMDRSYGSKGQAIKQIEPPAQTEGKPGLTWRPTEHPKGSPHPYRIQLVIALKDLREAFNNKIVLAILITTLLIVLMNSALPYLLRNRSNSVIVVLDQGASIILRNMKDNSALIIHQVSNQAQLEQALTVSMQDAVGLVLPVDFDQRLALGETVMLQGYSPYWADPLKIKTLAEAINQALSQESTGQVAIDGQIQHVYAGKGFSGQPFMISMIMIFMLLVMGITLTPVLFVEEKESHTVEALLVSPAKPQQIVIGKGLAGITLGLISAGVILAVNSYLFIHWGIILLAVVSCLVFSVALGLLLGAYCENPSVLSLWATMVMLILIATTLAFSFLGSTTPEWLANLLQWMPGAVMIRLVNFSMNKAPDGWMILVNAGLLIGLGLVFYRWTVWKVGRWR